jgi:acyl carrier protein
VADANEDASAETRIVDFIVKETAPREELLPIRRDTMLIETGILDSLSILRLVSFLQEGFGVNVTAEDVIGDNFETVDSIIKFINGKKK